MFWFRVVLSEEEGAQLVVITAELTTDLLVLYQERKEEIASRLNEFSRVDASEWFYEACFCLLTPQSKAIHANAVIDRLKEGRYFEKGQEVTHILGDPLHYIRFHNVKAQRLQLLRKDWQQVNDIIRSDKSDPMLLRSRLVDNINGYGMKEASHFLRNIGFKGLAILDRHILNELVRCNFFAEVPSVSTRQRYLAVEVLLRGWCQKTDISIDELDLLLWCSKTGYIFK